MSVILSTDSIVPRERMEYWSSIVGRVFVPSDIAATPETPFSGTITTDRLGYLQIATVDAVAQRVRRTSRLIAEAEEEYLLVGLQARGTAVLTQDGRTAPLRPGEFALYDVSRPYTLDFPGHHQQLIFRLPRRMLGLPETDLRRITCTAIGSGQGLASVAVPFLSKLATDAETYGPEVGEMLARNVVDLLATVITERLGQDPAATDAGHQTLLLRIRAFINDHLADPALSPEVIAAAHHISVRYLHSLFHGEGTTVSRWILHRRLEECRRELGRPRRSRPAVAAVAHRGGFSSPAHFSRAFRAAYGMSPREWQYLVDHS
ncbi:helix-turn-helix domain-containing protein [Streptomyces sp. ISID311]|uniref:AraC-like ligand-binding domain-containing protein n=1 Tax=Streptomyces sp. ISID311 TaxID=2601673 RepID=UPI0011BD3CD0|nr:helix-turn-helix domain-containing protein [Streptomyces sp. ISID311]TXC99909.1 helix-turn-helix domain-containing protein [Streptomyces sp. ISID311]